MPLASGLSLPPQAHHFNRHGFAKASPDHAFSRGPVDPAEIHELLKDVHETKGSEGPDVKTAVHDLRMAIESLKKRSPQPFDEATKRVWDESRVTVPMPAARPKQSSLPALGFARPTAIYCTDRLLDSSADGTPVAELDLTLMMPTDLFLRDDFMDYQYYVKRAFYLACIAAGLVKVRHLGLKLRFFCVDDNPLRPAIVAQPHIDHGEVASGQTFRINIMCVVAGETFPKEVMYPWQACVNPVNLDWPGSRPQSAATPFYNSTLRSESSAHSHRAFVEAIKVDHENFESAAVLLALWLRQRGYGTRISKGGFGAFEAAFVLAQMLQSHDPTCFNGWGSSADAGDALHLFCAVLRFLCSTNLTQSPRFVKTDPKVTEAWSGNHGPVLFDGETGLNILYKMSRCSYEELRFEAQATLDCLQKAGFEILGPTFLFKVCNPWLRFDERIWISDAGPFSRAAPHTIPEANSIVFCDRIFLTLQSALGDRVTMIHVSIQQSEAWDLSTSIATSNAATICIGLVAHHAKGQRLVDRGPATGDPAANAFREFWGAKSQLRRFRDGSICESLVWSERTEDDTPIFQVASFALSRHLGQALAPTTDTVAFDAFVKCRSTAVATGLLKDVEQLLPGLAGLPLRVRQMQPTVPKCRLGRSVFETNNGKGCDFVEAVVEFESSSRWPDDTRVVQKTKAAFLLKLGGLLADALHKASTRLVIDGEVTPEALETPCLEVVRESAVVRLRLHHERERVLLKQILDSAGSSHLAKQASSKAIASCVRRYGLRPRHTAAIDGLSTRFPSLGPCVRMLRHWCASHLLTNFLCCELLETLVARVFTHPHPYAIPANPRTAFLRVIALLARWNWKNEPLVVELGPEMTNEEIKAIQIRFEAWRRVDPSMNRVSLFLGTSIDPEGVAWTDGKIPAVVAARLASLAQAALAEMQDKAFNPRRNTLFTTPLEQYDFLIQLELIGKVSSKPSGPHLRRAPTWDVADTELQYREAVQDFLGELNTRYRDVTLLFYGEHGSVIAGLWRPPNAPRPWRVHLGYSTVPSGASGNLDQPEPSTSAWTQVNRIALLNEMGRLGRDLVSSIVSKDQGWKP